MSETITPYSDKSHSPYPQNEEKEEESQQYHQKEEKEKHLDSLFDAALGALEVLENSRVVLHSSLQEAHFSFNITQHEMERVGLLLAWDAVPTQKGAVQPHIGVRTPAVAKDINHSHTEKNCDNNNNNNKWSLVEMRVDEGRDPLRWFAAVPSPALCGCQEQFRRVLHACVDVLQAQKEALAAAAVYREAIEKRELHQ
ncbi:hypothetical protein LSM04_004107 [Trypanosoma melophagium]|uniref:uncharacterized protein n=1 Tax=Trypanosoma melophagium TaxID=715481 RepID=UPI00351A9C09|nr:hypothetical protein LSM04_004107 [Trypanosoma melophagium]